VGTSSRRILGKGDAVNYFLRSLAAHFLFCLAISLICPRGALAAANEEQSFQKEVHGAMVADNWQECDAICELFLRKHKAHALANAVKGYALVQQGQDKRALPYFDAAIKGGCVGMPASLAESHANNIWSLRGYSLMRSGKFAEGIKDLEKSLEIKPKTCLDILNQRIDCINIGTAYKKMNDVQKSVSYFNAGDLMKKQYHHIFYPVLKTPAEAKYNAMKLLPEMKSDPKSTILICKYAALQVYLRNWSEALKYLDKTIAVEPYLMPARLLRAQSLKRLKRNQDAKKDIDVILATREKAGVNVWSVDQKELNGVLRL
jgi:tetratricopeptide (TPR) repeat protein